jgi:hypothetical protein
MNKEIEMFKRIIKWLFKKEAITTDFDPEDTIEFSMSSRWLSSQQLNSLLAASIDFEEEN